MDEPSLSPAGSSQASRFRQHSVELPYQLRARDFVDLHDQVHTSVNLLDSLEGFLSTFQKDLSSVSGQISNLQDRSKDIDSRLKSRRRIEKPLSNLIVDLCISPALTTLILDTRVDDNWILAIGEFSRRLGTLKQRVRVKAARDLTEVAEGLRLVAATKLRTFFLALLDPIKTSMTTNLQVLQSSVWMKYRPLYVFLQQHAPDVATEIQRAYVSAVRTFFETGFRRYLRGLSWIKARTVEKTESITTAIGEGPDLDPIRLSYGRVDGPSVTMAYMADDKNHKEPLEALVRAALLVLMDNATAEYAFITAFFAKEVRPPLQSRESSSNMISMSPPVLSPTEGEFNESRSGPGSDVGSENMSPPRRRVMSITGVIGSARQEQLSFKEEQAALNTLWKQVMDPVLDYCQTFIQNAIEPAPPVVPLLTIIRLTEDVASEVQRRNCGPLEMYIFAIRLKMWPVFQKLMAENIDALKKYAEGASASYFRRGASTTDAAVSNICRRYVIIFNSFVALTDQPEETMIFSNLLRLRQELSKLIATHTDKLSDPVAKASAQSAFYEQLLQGLSNGPHPTSHPKSQSELAYWRERDEESRRRVVSAHGRR